MNLLKLTPGFLTIASLILLLGETSIPAPSIASGIETAAPSGGESQAQPVQMAADPVIKQAIGDVSAQQIRQTIEKLVTFGTRQTLSVNNPGAASSDKGIVAARNWIRSEFDRYSAQCGGCLEVKTDTFIQQPEERIPQPTEIQNVYAILRGADPAHAEHIYLVTGHYDSRNSDPLNSTDPAPGANDDASGTAVSLECARVLSKHKFPATLVFLAVAGEEQGLNGSAHFARIAKDAGWQLDGVLNNDIVGGNRTPGDTRQNENWVRVFSEGLPAAATDADLRRIRATGGENDSSSRQLARYVREVSHVYDFGQFTPKLIFRRDRYLRGGDHMSFNEQGFAAVRFTEYREDFHHQHQTPRVQDAVEYGDLVKFVDFDYVASVARLNAATLASLAAAPPKPSQVQLLTNQLENNSKFNWQVSAGADAYQVLWRDTTEADFPEENTTPTAQTTIEIQESKDNVIFGVRATDAQGHHSLIAVPQPVRERTPAGGS